MFQRIYFAHIHVVYTYTCTHVENNRRCGRLRYTQTRRHIHTHPHIHFCIIIYQRPGATFISLTYLYTRLFFISFVSLARSQLRTHFAFWFLWNNQRAYIRTPNFLQHRVHGKFQINMNYSRFESCSHKQRHFRRWLENEQNGRYSILLQNIHSPFLSLSIHTFAERATRSEEGED